MAQLVYGRGAVTGRTRQERAEKIRKALREGQSRGVRGTIKLTSRKKKRVEFYLKSPEAEQAVIEKMAEKGDIITKGRGRTAQQRYLRTRKAQQAGLTGGYLPAKTMGKDIYVTPLYAQKLDKARQELSIEAHKQYVQRGKDIQKLEHQQRYWTPEYRRAYDEAQAEPVKTGVLEQASFPISYAYETYRHPLWKWKTQERPISILKDGKLTLGTKQEKGYFIQAEWFEEEQERLRKKMRYEKGEMKPMQKFATGLGAEFLMPMAAYSIRKPHVPILLTAGLAGGGGFLAKHIGAFGLKTLGVGKASVVAQVASRVPSVAFAGYSGYMFQKSYRESQKRFGDFWYSIGGASPWVVMPLIERGYQRVSAKMELARKIPKAKRVLAKGVKGRIPAKALNVKQALGHKGFPKAAEVTTKFLKKRHWSELIVGEKPRLLVGGSASQRAYGKLMRLPKDIDVYAAFPALRAEQLLKAWRKVGVKGASMGRVKSFGVPHKESVSLFLKGGLHPISFHTKVYRRLFPYYKPLGETTTTEGIRVIGLKEQALRKLEGFYSKGRAKDLPDFWAVFGKKRGKLLSDYGLTMPRDMTKWVKRYGKSSVRKLWKTEEFLRLKAKHIREVNKMLGKKGQMSFSFLKPAKAQAISAYPAYPTYTYPAYPAYKRGYPSYDFDMKQLVMPYYKGTEYGFVVRGLQYPKYPEPKYPSYPYPTKYPYPSDYIPPKPPKYPTYPKYPSYPSRATYPKYPKYSYPPKLPPLAPAGIPPLPSIRIFKERKKRKGKVIKRKFRYLPSLTASTFKIYGKAPRILTGTETRVIDMGRIMRGYA